MGTISFTGRVVIVTGAGGGIGRTYALDIAKRGGAVIVNDLGSDIEGRSASRNLADRVVAEIRAAGGVAIANHEDVADAAGARRLVSVALAEFGRVDAVINNAGNMRTHWFEDCTEEDLDALVGVHLGGSFQVTRAAWPHLKAQRYGRIVFTSSSSGLFGTEMQSAYAAAKAGILGLMNVLALEGEVHGILCNALLPFAKGRMADRVSESMSPETLKQAMSMAAVIQDSLDPSFNTGLAVYLASEHCETTHSIYSQCAGRIARVSLGVTPGWQGSRSHPASAEDVAAHIEQIRDLSRGTDMPTSAPDELRMSIMGSPSP